MHHITQSASGREIHASINPALAGFDRALRRSREPVTGYFHSPDERSVFLAHAQAVVVRTRLLWG